MRTMNTKKNEKQNQQERKKERSEKEERKELQTAAIKHKIDTKWNMTLNME